MSQRVLWCRWPFAVYPGARFKNMRMLPVKSSCDDEEESMAGSCSKFEKQPAQAPHYFHQQPTAPLARPTPRQRGATRCIAVHMRRGPETCKMLLTSRSSLRRALGGSTATRVHVLPGPPDRQLAFCAWAMCSLLVHNMSCHVYFSSRDRTLAL
jgi:hypothetical protein